MGQDAGIVPEAGPPGRWFTEPLPSATGCPQLAAGAVDQGAITTAEARRWLDELAEAADHGTFLWATTGFAVAARTRAG